MRPIARIFKIAVFIGCVFLSNAAFAASGDAAANAQNISVWNDKDLDARLDTLTQALESQQTEAQYWEYGWGAFDTGTFIWSAVQASTEHNRKDRSTDIVQAGESLIGLADLIFRPLPALSAGSLCRDPVLTRQQKMQCLSAREALLKASAERAHEPYELLPHLGNLGFNLAAGLLVSRVADTRHALITAIPGEVIGEIQLWTTPGRPIKDWDRYQLRFSPLLTQSEHTNIPATGIMAKFTF